MNFPQTSKSAYLTGHTALNIPSDEGTGDWHILDSLSNVERFRVAGKNCISTNDVFGTEGIFNCAKIMKKYGANIPSNVTTVYAANHYRAMADLIWDAVKRKIRWMDSFIADDWFPAPEDKEKLRKFLNKGVGKLPIEERKAVLQWMARM